MLQFDISILVRRHPGGASTVSTLEGVDLSAWGLDPELLEEDLVLALTDRLERSHPSLLHRFHAPRGRTGQRIPIDEQLVLAGLDGPEPRELHVDAVLEPDLEHRRVRLPALKASLWLDDSTDPLEAVQTLVTRMLEGVSIPERLRYETAAGAELRTLRIDVEAAPLASFTGEHANLMLLPAPEPPKSEEQKALDKRVPTPMLDRIALEMTGPDAHLSGAFGRDEEVGELLRMLERPGASVVVIGPPTSGKTAVVEEVARRLDTRRGWYLDASRLVTAEAFSDWRQQTLTAVNELGEAEGVWFVGNPLPLIDAGKHVASEMNVAQVLKPYLSSGQLRVLAECSEAAWGKLEARDMGFARLFTPYRLTDPGREASHDILHALAPTLSVPVTAEGVDASLELAERYGRPEAQLGAAAQFLRRLTAEARSLGRPGSLTRRDVLNRFCAETGMPELLVRDDLPLAPDAVRAFFSASLVGQDDAIDHLVDLIAVIKGGMSDLDRPLGSFLFVGPTGVGKTEAAKALARWMFGSGDARAPARLLRFDMSEYSGSDCVVRLLDPTSGLVAAVRRRPFAVVLLDEIEKAHPAVFDLLLQVLGEARLSDSDGHSADFRNTVVLMTSNLGVGTFRRPTGFGGDANAALQDHVLASVASFFRPEFFNRIDRVVPFASLHVDAIGHIATREVALVSGRPGLRQRGVDLAVDEAAVQWLAARGVDPAFGARPLKRAVQDHLVAPLARHLAGSGHRGAVEVDVGAEGLRFRNRAASETTIGLDAIHALMERLAELRWIGGQWASSTRAREAAQEVALVDRLMSSKRFWADQRAATARSTALEPVRAAVVGLASAREGIEAVEDLVHEAWMDQRLDDLDALTVATDEAAAALTDATLTMLGSALPSPDRIRLVFYHPEEDQPGFRRDLVATYLNLAVDEEWSVSSGSGSSTVRWPSDDLTQPKFLKKAFGGRSTTVDLTIEGRHAAVLLMGETGGHVFKHPSTPVKVPVRAILSGGIPEDPPLQRFRRFDPGRKQVQDVSTKLTTTLHTRQERSIRRLIDLRVLVAALGDRLGRRIWKGTRG